MLALFGVLIIAVILVLIMTKKMQTMIALIIVPIVGALIAGYSGLIVPEEGVFTLETLGTYIIGGLRNIAPTGVMFIFAILFFGILTNSGTFDPIIKKILSLIGKDPIKISLGTLALSSLIHLDGSGAVTFLIAIPALLPLYKAIGMSPVVLTTIVAMGAGVMNMVPWGGPTLRAITAMNSTVADIYNPMIIPQIAGLIAAAIIAFFLGRREKNRIGAQNLDSIDISNISSQTKEEDDKYKRPHLFWFNILLIAVSVVVLIMAWLPPAVIFMIATSIALLVNYRDIKLQKEVVDSHATSALMMASMLFAAGSFIGIMQNSGMLTAMSEAIVQFIPATLGTKIPAIIGVFSMPLSLVFDPDSYYFGVMPVLANAMSAYGVDPTMIARASILGQMTTGFPISPLTGSTFLLVGLAGVDLGEHQKKAIPLLWLVSIVILVVAIVFGSITI